MVLAELGGALRSSLRKLHGGTSGAIDEEAVTAVLSDISRALIEADVNVQTVMTLRNNIKTTVMAQLESNQNHAADAEVIRRTIQKSLLEELVKVLTPQGVTPYKLKRSKPNVILFVGLQGAGKTTTIAKYAHYHQRRGYKTAMVCADTFRAGAFDQLKQNATKLRIPFYGSYTEADPVAIAQEGVEQFIKDKYELILVDTSGRHRQESGLLEEMQEIATVVHPNDIIFVMDATQGQAVYDQALAFHEAVDVGSVIVTKLDGHAKGGGALSAVAATQSPIVFLGEGEHLDDLDPFNPQGFVSNLLGMGDVKGLMEQLKSVHEDGSGKSSQKELMEKMSKGVFTLKDMYKQFENMLKLGPMNKVMGMIPGVPEYLIPKNSDGDDEGSNRLKKFMYMMDSMTNAEMDGKVDLHNYKTDENMMSRIKRIARGSGTHPEEVKMLLLCHKQFEGVVSKMGKAGGGGGMTAAQQKQMADKMKRNPNEVMKRINQMDPATLRQLGGTENVMSMLKGGGGGGGGMPNMDAMQALMGGGMPGMGGGGGGGGMPDMSALQAMMGGGGGGGGGGMPDMAALQAMMGGGGGGGGGMAPPPGMPPGMDMEKMMQMMQQMGMGNGMGGMPR
jgi:signal recognition particle subunit SRP54